MYEKHLVDAGLTQNEAKVYLALLKMGKSSSGKLVKEAAIAGGKIYETLYKLVNKGLVEVIIENGVKKFIAADAQSLLLYMEERKNKVVRETNKLAEIVPELQKLQELQESPENVYLIKGIRGIKPLVYKVLSEGKEEAKIMGVRSSKNTTFNIFWQHWHKERVRLGKKARMLFTDRNTPYWEFFTQLNLTKIKSTPSRISPSAIMVMDDHSCIFSYDEEFTCIYIRSSSIAKSFTSFFEGLWSIGQP